MIQFLDYNQSMNSPEACRRRLIKYLLPVIIFSISFNITKFMEAKICWELNESLNTSYVIEFVNEEDSKGIDNTVVPRTASLTSDDSENINTNVNNTHTYFSACDSDIPNNILLRDKIMDIPLWYPRVRSYK